MLKYLLTTTLAVLFIHYSVLAQSFPNINLSQVPQSCINNSTSVFLNQFACQGNDACNTAPWHVSHGSPDIAPNRFIFAGSAIRSNGNISESHNEGVQYRQTFLRGKWYKINITYFLDAKKFTILLANGVPVAPCNVPSRSFLIPNVSDNQFIFRDETPSSTTKNQELVFIPNKDFECLWIFPEDNTVQEPDIFHGITFKINSIICTESAIKEINSNVDNLDGSLYGSSIVPIHFSLPPQTTAQYIHVIPRKRVDILPNLATVPYTYRDPHVKLIAEKSILIKPDPNLSSSTFEAVRGSIFSAFIAPNSGCDDACEAFTPWGTPYHNIFWRTSINTCSSTTPSNEWRPISSYPKPYNAYRVKLSIYGRLPDGSVGSSPVFQQVWEDSQKRGLASGIVVWKPASVLPLGVYAAHMEFTNCNGFYELWTDITIGCGLRFSDNQNIAVQNPNEYNYATINLVSVNKNANEDESKVIIKNSDIVIYPNPTSGLLNLSSNVDLEKVTIEVNSILGVNLLQTHNNYLSKNVSYEYDISSLLNGIYFITLRRGNKIIYNSKIIKL